MKNLRLIGRVIFALPYLYFGINYFVNFILLYAAELTTIIALSPFTIFLTGVLLIAVAISILSKKYVNISPLYFSNSFVPVHWHHSHSVIERRSTKRVCIY